MAVAKKMQEREAQPSELDTSAPAPADTPEAVQSAEPVAGAAVEAAEVALTEEQEVAARVPSPQTVAEQEAGRKALGERGGV